MPTIEQSLVAFFEQVAQKKPCLLEEIEQQECFRVERTRWCFTLPDLHHFLAHQNDIFGDMDYKQFRKLIFNSPINPAVKTHGAEVQIAENRSKVDRTSYALVWPASNSPAP